ncbi:hypothetical protein KA405_06265 [Patescibacteria group bacterium]|nr:hypothetical protein [Patescibacteria group bacterium]
MVLEFNARQIVVIPHLSIVVLVHGDLENISEKRLRQEGSSRGAYHAPVREGNGSEEEKKSKEVEGNGGNRNAK